VHQILLCSKEEGGGEIRNELVFVMMCIWFKLLYEARKKIPKQVKTNIYIEREINILDNNDKEKYMCVYLVIVL